MLIADNLPQIEKFKIPEKCEGTELACGVAVTTEEQLERLRIVTERYIVEKYLDGIEELPLDITPKELINLGLEEFIETIGEKAGYFLKNGIVIIVNIEGVPTRLFIDKYQWNSIPFVVRDSSGYIGSLRLIMESNIGLPTVNEEEIKIDAEWRSVAEATQIEISQLAKTVDSPKTVMLALLRSAIQFSRRLKIEDWLATTDERVIRLLNGLMCFDIKPIGDPVKYLGSISIPGFINISNTLKSIDERSSITGLAQFLNGDSHVKGYEWYRGI